MNTLKKIALTYKQKMNINVLPLKGKKPIINWDKWQNERQTEDDIDKMDWNNSTGLGAIQGVNDWRCIDIDGAEGFEIVELILHELEFPERYDWTIQSGSGEGFHLHIRIKENDELLKKLGGKKAVYKLKMNNNGSVSPSESRGRYCKHIELRWMNCQTAIPPSLTIAEEFIIFILMNLKSHRFIRIWRN